MHRQLLTANHWAGDSPQFDHLSTCLHASIQVDEVRLQGVLRHCTSILSAWNETIVHAAHLVDHDVYVHRI